jgi:threonylcarbamoyladenosine tRNA methylthiotransferase MtaB
LNIHLKALGCRLNEAELESWALEFQQAGHRLVTDVDEADVTVLNTCAVTTEAVRKSRKLINRVRRENPTGKLVVSGCMVSTGEAGSGAELGVDMLVDNSEKSALVQRVNRRWQIPIMPEGATLPNESALFARNRQRAFIKIQDGCRYRCSYCIVTIARGDEKSRSLAEILSEINELESQGVNEIVLTGVHVGGYGSDINTDLQTLVTNILTNTSIARIRFASVEPWDLGENFFSLFENKRVMPHMHLPIQSGSDTVLKRMSRRCHTSEFSTLVNQARQSVQGFNVTTDIIVGFPGESEHEWQETLQFVSDTGFGHVHVFSYSAREGTKAAGMADQVTADIKTARSRQLIELAGTQREAFLQAQTGRTAQVLWERCREKDGQLVAYGYTENYARVATRAMDADSVTNTIRQCSIGEPDVRGQHLWATIT